MTDAPRDSTRRQFLAATAGAAVAALSRQLPAEQPEFQLNYIVASCMYGKAPLAEILDEVPRTGARFIEIWAERHGNQREQIDEMGVEACQRLLAEKGVRLGSFTCFKYGLLNMRGEMELVRQLGGDLVICNSGGRAGLTGDALDAEIRLLVEKLKPEVEFAQSTGVAIGVENHSGGLIASRESQLRLLDLLPSKHLGIALAPYHLPQDSQDIAALIETLGDRLLHMQAWEHGNGCMTKLPKEEELLQLPHRGPLDWTPILAALKRIRYAGRTEIFMHPTPRGIPILPTADEVTAEINRSRAYLEECLTRV